ncbi:beta-galactosidase [Agilicoccus flavus]|uniref:beta-galactosidase n=1 Tax=Agilicoccus flavus TaxID=2775968 RepID=UPI001CF6AF89|nr:beta-galactosidase [Agilicoccus flavus]
MTWERINAGGIGYGGDYNPEQWDAATWRQDVDLMRRAGVTFVTVGVFSWSHLEPREGEYEFEWLDEVMDLLGGHGIAVDLATATATPPPWLSRAYPQILPVDVDGRTLWPGSRQAWCPTSPVFREKAVALAGRVAQRYADHPALAMWHVSNEYACHNLPCYCDTCAAAFRVWLARRYPDLDALDHAWGTAFWSQRYGDLEEVLPPRRTTTIANPTHVLDYRRFSSDALLDQFRAETAAVREHSPDVPLTTNFMTMTHFDHLDYHRWAPHVDVVSTDHYVVDTLPHRHAELAFSGDVTRGLAGGGPWMLMEHSTSAVNWQPTNPAKRSGQTLRDSLAHVARGADTVGYFQWRASRAGAEKWHSAMLPHAGADSARFREVCELGAVLGRLRGVAGSRVEAPVAILHDTQARWAAEGPAMPDSALGQVTTGQEIHRALRAMGVSADLLHPDVDLSGYDVLVVPTLYLVTDENARRIGQAARAGAHVLVTFFSGVVDEHDHVRLGGYPGAFADLLGVRVEEFDPLLPGDVVALAGGGSGSAWTEHVTLASEAEAAVLDSYASGRQAGRPAMTRRDLPGGGSAWYCSTLPDEETLRGLLAGVLDAAGVAHAALPDGLEIVRRTDRTTTWTFALNHAPAAVRVPCTGHDLVSGREITEPFDLEAGGVAVLARARA